MREIKFRGLRTDGKVWIYGDLIHSYWSEGNTFMPTSIRYLIDGIYSYPIEVIHETVGQFTGLTDKNGVEIYEGDIVELGNGKVYKIAWNNIFSAFRCEIQDDMFATYFSKKMIENLEIIGNIHENQ